ncbi:hypothetical protein TWF970_011401 [Orbilia oligospora]|uniref:Uncharacterized protein n=1 Tax=Orbilia oligospora TaxID=2813651 RepID=A0A7C8REP0_ORBOL|nr:hypothetical protein TWF970_011401 [Orbilia oligospora]
MAASLAVQHGMHGRMGWSHWRDFEFDPTGSSPNLEPSLFAIVISPRLTYALTAALQADRQARNQVSFVSLRFLYNPYQTFGRVGVVPVYSSYQPLFEDSTGRYNRRGL